MTESPLICGGALPLWGMFVSGWLFFLFLLASPLAAASITVTVADEKTVAGSRVTLGDIAEIQALDQSGAALAPALAAIDLGPAPGPGQITVLRRGQLEQRFRSVGVDLAGVEWSLPAELRLVGQGQDLTEDILRQALANHLAGLEPYRSGNFKIVSAAFGQLPTLPPGRAAYRFVPQSLSNPTSITGTFFFAVDGKESGRVRVSAAIDLEVETLVAARNLSKGQVLTESDLTIGLVSYAQSKGALTEASIAVGQTLKNSLTAGEPLRERFLAKSIIVRRGEMVTIIAQQGSLRITAAGQAKQDGVLGETISVVNINSKKTISAKVTAPGQVSVMF